VPEKIEVVPEKVESSPKKIEVAPKACRSRPKNVGVLAMDGSVIQEKDRNASNFYPHDPDRGRNHPKE
jgi:hypothetical protein